MEVREKLRSLLLRRTAKARDGTAGKGMRRRVSPPTCYANYCELRPFPGILRPKLRRDLLEKSPSGSWLARTGTTGRSEPLRPVVHGRASPCGSSAMTLPRHRGTPDERRRGGRRVLLGTRQEIGGGRQRRSRADARQRATGRDRSALRECENDKRAIEGQTQKVSTSGMVILRRRSDCGEEPRRVEVSIRWAGATQARRRGLKETSSSPLWSPPPCRQAGSQANRPGYLARGQDPEVGQSRSF